MISPYFTLYPGTQTTLRNKIYTNKYTIIHKQLPARKRKARKKIAKAMAMVINPYFQNYYKIFSRHRYMRADENIDKKTLEESKLNLIIDFILDYIQQQPQYKNYSFWKRKIYVKQYALFIAKHVNKGSSGVTCTSIIFLSTFIYC